MNGDYDGGADRPGAELERLRGIWVLLLLMGLALIVLGAVAISFSFIATLATMMMFGILLLIGAAFQVVAAILGRSWKGFFLHLLAGILYLIGGLFMVERPLDAAEALTLMIAAFLLVGGVFRIVLSLVNRFDGWVWMLLNGVISLVLGVAIWRQWPWSGFWVIGLFVGIEMIFSGVSWVMLSLAVRSIPKGARPA